MPITVRQALSHGRSYRPVPREGDGTAKLVHGTGGFRAARADAATDMWMVQPLLVNGVPSARGRYSRAQVQRLMKVAGITAIALEDISWSQGIYFSHWMPVLPDKSNHFINAADLWRNIAMNLSEVERPENVTTFPSQGSAQQGPEAQRICSFISLSFRNMDIAVSGIVDFYHQQLTDGIARGPVDGQRHASVLDQNLYSHVQTFFMHAGAARDYLAWLIAIRVGIEADALNRLGQELRSSHFGTDTLLDTLLGRQLIGPHATKTSQWVAAGWLKELSDRRNTFIHKRPYGGDPVERWGTLRAVSADDGLYRYIRLVNLGAGDEGDDVLDLIVRYYHLLNRLFEDLAQLSGYNCDIRTITDDDLRPLAEEGGVRGEDGKPFI